VFNKNSIIIEAIFITALFGYLTFQIVRTFFVRLAEKHPSIKRILVKFHLDDAP
jgi:hypothetical protein